MRFLTIFLASFLLLCIQVDAQQKSDVVTNKTVMQLQKAGLGNELLKTKIQNSACKFDLSTDGLIELKKAGVDNEIISCMFAKAGSTPAPSTDNNKVVVSKEVDLTSGIYYHNPVNNKDVEIEPAVLTNLKSDRTSRFIPNSLIRGLVGNKNRASISDSMAQIKLQERLPVFIFVFDETKKGLNSYNAFSSVQSPKEFFLVKMTRVKNTREIVVSKGNSVSIDIGVEDKCKVSFVSQKIKNGVYQVTVEKALLPGEYCFMFSATSRWQGGATKIYDFSIQ